MNTTMYVYRLDPIDDFHLWMDPTDIFNKTGADDLRSFDEFEEVFDTAKVSAKLIGWDGDIREGPFVSVLPPGGCGEQSLFIIAWKQDNNGTSFVASPYALPWLATENSAIVRCDIVRRPGELIISRKIEKACFLKVS